jgi:hypothetical protein
MDWSLFTATTVCFAIAIAVIWTRYFGVVKRNGQNRKVGYRREEFEIDSNSVPEFKATWQNKQ